MFHRFMITHSLFCSGSSNTASSVSYSSKDLVRVISDLQTAIEINENLKNTVYLV